ncbi:ADP-ribosylation factor-like protein 11 [Electrophorus electricus]|uniref:ADP-ribosylation factor-like protein 14 n=1 Tax=Electrophorus electricus TaxID=8005 RepID=A0A4W4HIJ9_ELEEL|nr:ADP-ribosylation factor-like protein 11 [Electrophorus electricus]
MGLIQPKQFCKAPQVVLIGLDSAGKSTLLYRLQRGVVMGTSPTIGFNVAQLPLGKKMALTIWDVGGQESMRPHWKHYLKDCEAVVFVLDASDHARVDEARKALKKVLRDRNTRDVPLLVLANKSDLPNSLTIGDVSKQLDLDSYTDRVWEVQPCSALNGLGVQQAFLSVARLIQKN